MADFGWARSRGERAEHEGLRRGAWYRVVEDGGKAWIVLDVHHVEVRVPKDEVEVRGEAPKTWSVVHDPHLVCPGVSPAPSPCRTEAEGSEMRRVRKQLPGRLVRSGVGHPWYSRNRTHHPA